MKVWLDMCVYISLDIVIQAKYGKNPFFQSGSLKGSNSQKKLSVNVFRKTRSSAVMPLIAEAHGEHTLVVRKPVNTTLNRVHSTYIFGVRHYHQDETKVKETS